MSTVIKSVRVEKTTIDLLQEYFDIINTVFHDKAKFNFSETVNNSLITLLGSYGEGLGNVLHEKGYHYRDKTGKMAFSSLSDDELKRIEEFVQGALGEYYYMISQE